MKGQWKFHWLINKRIWQCILLQFYSIFIAKFNLLSILLNRNMYLHILQNRRYFSLSLKTKFTHQNIFSIFCCLKRKSQKMYYFNVYILNKFWSFRNSLCLMANLKHQMCLKSLTFFLFPLMITAEKLLHPTSQPGK